MNQRMWMVRAGEGSYLFSEFKNKKFVAIGWLELGDLSKINTPLEIKAKVKQTYASEKEGYISITAGQINRFIFDFKVGDKIVTYDSKSRIYLVGEITSDYKHDPKLCEYPNIRYVTWLGEVSRDKLSVSTKNTLGAISTLFEVGVDAAQDVLKQINNKSETVIEEIKVEDELKNIKEDIKSKSREFIKDKVLLVSWDDMQELVAGILRGMKYKTILSPKGPDRGKDIQASPDGLGLEDPRIFVEVKHREGQIGASEIRSFIAGLRPGSKGIYVSTGGFSKEAKYEAERSNVPITLIDLDKLVDLIIQHYDKFDAEARILIPLTKIYWPE